MYTLNKNIFLDLITIDEETLKSVIIYTVNNYRYQIKDN